MHFKISQLFLLATSIYLTALCFIALSMDLFNVQFIETPDSRMIATSNYNYAISSPKLLAKDWLAVSVNGDNIVIINTKGESLTFNRTAMGIPDMALIESLRDGISSGNNGYRHLASSSIGGNTVMSSSSGGGTSSSFSSSSSGGTITTSNGGRMGSTSVDMKDESNFSVSKSDFPFNLSRVFYNGPLVTFVSRDGTVQMKPLSSLEGPEAEFANNLKQEVKTMQATQKQEISNVMQNSMGMVSNVFSNIMGNFPKPPEYSTAVGNMFGNNFPFGPNNSPFGSASGGPLSGGAFAFAGRRR